MTLGAQFALTKHTIAFQVDHLFGDSSYANVGVLRMRRSVAMRKCSLSIPRSRESISVRGFRTTYAKNGPV